MDSLRGGIGSLVDAQHGRGFRHVYRPCRCSSSSPPSRCRSPNQAPQKHPGAVQVRKRSWPPRMRAASAFRPAGDNPPDRSQRLQTGLRARGRLRCLPVRPEQESALSSSMLAQTAYAATAPVRTSRGTEYAAFQKVTARMMRATVDGVPFGRTPPPRFQENRRLWTVLATDLADDANALPDTLRARLLFSCRIHTSDRGACAEGGRCNDRSDRPSIPP